MMFRRRQPRMRDAAEATKFGFRWDQVDVIRVAELQDYKLIGVQTDFGQLTIYISPSGQGIRVFDGSREWLPEA